MAIPLSKYLRDAAERDRRASNLETCKVCGVPLQEAIYGYRHVAGGACCSDCYFDDISALIDAHPIGRPMSTLLAAKS